MYLGLASLLAMLRCYCYHYMGFIYCHSVLPCTLYDCGLIFSELLQQSPMPVELTGFTLYAVVLNSWA